MFFRTALPCSGGYHLERGGGEWVIKHGFYAMRWRKRGETTENQSVVPDIKGNGCAFDDCVRIISLDIITLSGSIGKMVASHAEAARLILGGAETVPI